MKSFKQHLLTEELYHELVKDAEYIYAKGIDAIYKDVKKFIPKVNGNESVESFWDRFSRFFKTTLVANFTSAELPSKTAQAAHAIFPIEIRVTILHNETQPDANYNTTKNTGRVLAKITGLLIKDSIQVFIPGGLFAKFKNSGMTVEQFAANSDIKNKRFMLDVLTGNDTKGIIYHELVHWVDNTKELIDWKHPEVIIPIDGMQNPEELKAQMHQIHIMKLQKGDKVWDKMSFEDLFDGDIWSFDFIHTKLKDKNPKRASDWKYKLYTLANKHGLLGKRMKKEVSNYSLSESTNKKGLDAVDGVNVLKAGVALYRVAKKEKRMDDSPNKKYWKDDKFSRADHWAKHKEKYIAAITLSSIYGPKIYKKVKKGKEE